MAQPVRLPSRILMTADAVGGVWTYALDLVEAFAATAIAAAAESALMLSGADEASFATVHTTGITPASEVLRRIVGSTFVILPTLPNSAEIAHAVNNMLCYQARPCGYDPRQMLFRGRGLRAIPFLLLGLGYDSRWATQKGADQPRPTADILAALTSMRTGPSGRSASVPNLAGGPPRTGFRCDSG